MRLARLCALSAVFCASPALAAVRKEILNRDEAPPGLPNPATGEGISDTEDMSLSGFNPDASTTSSLATSSSRGFSNSTSTTTTTSSTIDMITVTPPTSPSSAPGLTTVTLGDPPSSASPSSISCVKTGADAPRTIISTSYTATTTFYGNSTDYTPPFPTLTSIPFCEETTRSKPPPGWTGSIPASSTTRNVPAPYPGTTTFVTTDKNPKVVFEPSPPPDYSSPRDPTVNEPGQHNTAEPDDHSRPSPSGGGVPVNPKPKPSPNPPPKPSITVTAGPDKVIIGTSTFKGLKPDESTTVVVDDETFTIVPTAVIGPGGTFERPAPAEPREWQPSPTSGNVGGVSISASGSVIEIDGQKMTIPSGGTTTQINGQDVSISPGEVQVGGGNFSWQATAVYNTDAIVVGGEMLTAIGPTIFVLNETTLTYGPDISRTEVTADNDVITLAPHGILVNNSTLGGPGAADDATTYAVVGGMTITRIGSSLIVIDGHTFTVNDNSGDITTFVGGERMTVGPDGVAIGTMTIGLDDDNMVTGTLEPGDKSGDGGPEETGTSGEDDEDEDDLAGALRPGFLLMALCFGLGVGLDF